MMHWRLAGDICGKVLTFAATGRGKVARLAPSDPNLFRIRTDGAAADIWVDRHSKTLSVLRIFEMR